MTGNGRWQLVLFDALAQAELVGVVAAVDRHLGRRASRVELSAVHRTAARLARDGQVTLHPRPGPARAAGAWRTVLVVARPDATLEEDRLKQAARGRTLAAMDSAAVEDERRTTARHAGQVVAGLEHGAVDARRVDVDHLPAEEAARLAEQLTVAWRR